MKSTALLVLLPVALGGCAKKADPPQIQLTDVGFTLHLPPAMQQALDAAAPGFHTIQTTSYRSDVAQAAAAAGGGLPALFAAMGDFDHDGTEDAVVEGTTPSDSSLQVIAIMNGAHPKAIPVEEIASYDADAVGIYLTAPTGGRKGAFQVVAYPDSSTLFTYSGGSFSGTKFGN
ncbi:MAG TPA: hypothetical protein VHB25_11480 [Gemmatimonadaceae bacterium]|nr:hypothetical protein [Gemmatimonadaceae bacterium]